MTVGSAAFANIQHFVVVMLENRSFDHLLGFLYTHQGNVSPSGQPFEGLKGTESNPDKSGKPVHVFRIQRSAQHSYYMPKADPGEGFANTNAQLFGTTSPGPTAQATNQGFVTNFDYTLGWESKKPGRVLPGTQPGDIMGMYTPDMLPILSSLAKGYAVCDHWFCSAPTETLPNRAFATMATSQGHLADDVKVYTAPSIFTLLGKNKHTWAVYGYDAPPLMRQLVADITHAPSSQFGQFKDFQAAVAKGTLANFVFLEPSWGNNGNSEHPINDISLGEQFLRQVYYTLYGSKIWPQTLLIITYDEHGGCYDHVPPPANAVPPDQSVGQFGFDFKRFGPRVPTILVSPWIAAGTVYRTTTPTPFDHTSILATVEERFGLSHLTARDAAAPRFGGVLSLSAPRTDDPLAGVAAPTSQEKVALSDEPTHLQLVLAESLAALPVGDREGSIHPHEMPAFKTGDEAVAFAQNRYREVYGE